MNICNIECISERQSIRMMLLTKCKVCSLHSIKAQLKMANSYAQDAMGCVWDGQAKQE